jgi:hypothetical protein
VQVRLQRLLKLTLSTSMRPMHIATTTPIIARRIAGARRGALAAVAMLAGAGLISACGSSSSGSTTSTKINLDTPHVARAIEQSILSERHVHAKVSCPAVILQQQGKSFVCIATTRNGKGAASKTPFAVTEQNDKGYVTYRAE